MKALLQVIDRLICQLGHMISLIAPAHSQNRTFRFINTYIDNIKTNLLHPFDFIVITYNLFHYIVLFRSPHQLPLQPQRDGNEVSVHLCRNGQNEFTICIMRYK